MSDGSGVDMTTIDDVSIFSFTASETDSLPFTVHDTDHTVTRKSQRVCYYSLLLDVFYQHSVMVAWYMLWSGVCLTVTDFGRNGWMDWVGFRHIDYTRLILPCPKLWTWLIFSALWPWHVERSECCWLRSVFASIPRRWGSVFVYNTFAVMLLVTQVRLWQLRPVVFRYWSVVLFPWWFFIQVCFTDADQRKSPVLLTLLVDDRRPTTPKVMRTHANVE